MRGRQPVGDLPRDVDRAPRVERAVSLENRRQRIAVDVFHDEIDDAVGFTVVEHGRDVGMQNARGIRRFARERAAPTRCRSSARDSSP